MGGLRLGELLVKKARLQPTQLKKALRLQKELGGRLGTNLLESGLISEDMLLAVLGEQRSTRTASRGELESISPSLLRKFPEKLATRYRLVPYRLEGRTLFVASMDIGDALIEDEIRMLTGTMVRTTLGLELRIRQALQRYFQAPCQDRFQVLARRLDSGGVIPAAKRQPAAPKPAAPPPRTTAPAPRPKPKPKRKPSKPRKPKASEAPRFIELDAEDEAALRAARAEPGQDSGQLDATDLDLPALEIPELEGGAAATSLAEPELLPPAPIPAVLQNKAPVAEATEAVDDDAAATEAASSTSSDVAADQPTGEAATPAEEVTAPPAAPPAGSKEAEILLPGGVRADSFWDPTLSIEERLVLAASAFQEAEIRDEIADVLLAFTAPYFSRRMLLIQRQDRIVGWRGEGERVRRNAVRAIAIEAKEPSVFLSVNDPSSFWLGPLPPLEPNQRLVAGLGGEAPKGCLVLPVVLRSKIVCYFYGDNQAQGVGGAPLAELRRLMGKAGITFEVYILKNKIRVL